MFTQNSDNIEERGFISKERILAYVSEEEIYELVFKFKPVDFDYVTSPFRVDTSPGCWFETSPLSNKLKFVDFAGNMIINGTRMINIDCFDAVALYYDFTNLYQTLDFIKKRLIDGKEVERRPAQERVTNNYKVGSKKPVEIIFSSRNFDNRDGNFWNGYEISKTQLIHDKVFAVQRFKALNTRKGDISTTVKGLCYAYTDFEKKHKKLYRPYKKGVGKFLTNCKADDVGGLRHLPKFGNQLIISKSYKDWRVLINQGISSVWFQNEGMIPSDNILLDLCRRFQQVVILFDNDGPGQEAAEKIAGHINCLSPAKATYSFIPERFINMKISDPSDLISRTNRATLLDFLKYSNIVYKL